ncbi:hypothetical protein IAD21_04354 [Abditibacteriota bacterium]|nr:hypothetical protein IAD21_04354 [Abditibacteriota bacterium]
MNECDRIQVIFAEVQANENEACRYESRDLHYLITTGRKTPERNGLKRVCS